MERTYSFYYGLMMKYLPGMIRNSMFIGIFLILSSCNGSTSTNSTFTGNGSPEEIVLYDWEDDIPQEVLDRFTEETGIKVRYATFGSMKEAEENLSNRNDDYDVSVVDNDRIPQLIGKDLLAEINYEFVPNFKYISINFRDLVHDPENVYSIPFNWGTTGIIFHQNNDFIAPSSWSDLWLYPDSVKIGIRHDLPYDNFAFTKRMMGLSINECDPELIRNVSAQFMLLGEKIVWVDSDAEASIDELENGSIDMLVGWADDVFEARDRGIDVVYVLPKEGTMLWGDSYVIPAESRNQIAAAQLINFLISPEISAKIIEYNNYASANDSVRNYLPSELINDPIIFPDNDAMRDSEIYLAVTTECNALQLDAWDKIIEAIE